MPWQARAAIFLKAADLLAGRAPRIVSMEETDIRKLDELLALP